MKVLKFGGTSVGTAETLRSVKKIVESQKEPVAVVVSALGGVTDSLLAISRKAASGSDKYVSDYRKLVARHEDVINSLFAAGPQKDALLARVRHLFADLGDLFKGVSLLKSLPQAISNQIVSYGERASSEIVNALICDSVLFDSLELIKTVQKGGKNFPDLVKTAGLIKSALGSYFDGGGRTAVVPGFISTDIKTGEITNLGRGGSDYTASIIASSLDASILEIWTDVDGFMTADPRIIKTSYVIEELTYREAMELCNCGAKIIYSPTLYPVRSKRIPIRIKNTFNPSAPGTVICEKCAQHDKAVTAMSSINESCLLTLSATSMVGLVGVDSRIFSALASKGISVFLICQSSSETGISIGVSDEDGDAAKAVLSKEFAHEIELGSIDPIRLQRGLSTIAVVGENMRNNAGLAGRLFSTLGKNGISVIACAQGVDETNISFVVDGKYLRKSLNVIHDSFFLSEYHELNLFICGVGTVGGRLIEQIASQREKLMKERNLKLNIVGIARSTKGIFDRGGLNLSDYRSLLENGKDINAGTLRDEIISMNIFNSVFVDCTASAEIAGIYKDLFEHGISVVAANKIAASSDYDNYRTLKDTARRRNVKYLFETNVGAGLPIINTINAMTGSGDRIQKIEAVLSGTLNFIFNTISSDIPFSRTVKMAQEQGFAEPDPRIDLSGKDVIRKLVILAREAGYKVEQSDVKANLFIPDEFFKCSMEDFWKNLPSLDADFEKRRQVLQKNNERWRFVARMENGEYSVSLQTVDSLHSFYVLDGSNNIVLLTTERYHEHPLLIQGYGAGADVTAAGVFSDIISIANV